MAGQRQISSPSRPQPVPISASPNASRGRSSGAETPRATSIARLASPVASFGAQGTPPVRQVPAPSQLDTENQTPLAGAEGSRSIPGPGQSALAAALQGSFGRSPPRHATPPLRPLSPSAAGAALQSSGPQTTYGSFESRSGHLGQRKGSAAPSEDPRIVKRHLVRPSNVDSPSDSGSNVPTPKKRPSLATVSNSRDGHTTTGIADDEFSSLRLQGGDITREVYRWTEEAESQAQMGGRSKRSKSWHISRPEAESEDLDVSSIRVPGGFRRDYLRRRAPDSNTVRRRRLDGGESQEEDTQPRAFITKNFYEFLTVYGHFAGEELEEDDEYDYFHHEPNDEEDERSEEAGSGEESALLTPGTRGRRKRKPSVRRMPGTNSATGAVLLLLKSFIGTGVLFLPRAYLNGGMLFSNLVLLATAALSYYCFILLVNTRLKVDGSFGDMGGILYGKWMRNLILLSVFLSQIGFVAAYIVFTSTSLQAFVQAVSNCRKWIDIKYMVLMQMAIFIPLSFIRDIGKLGATALIADFFIMLGLIYLAYFDIGTLASKGLADVISFNPHDWTLFIGTAIFTFEGVGLIIPIQESMKQPAKFPPVLAGVMITITIVFTGIGALSYAAFGASTKTVVLLNLPQDNKVVNGVQFLYSLAILLSTPLQLFPAIRIMENEMFSRSGKTNIYVKWGKNTARLFLVVVCAIIAWAGADDLDKFVALVGSFACVPLVYVYPAMLHLRAVAESRKQRIADIILCVFGFIVMVYTTALTLQSWAKGSGPKSPSYCGE